MKKTLLVISLTLVIVIAVSGSILLLNQTINKNAEGEDVQVNTSLTEDVNQTLNINISEFKFTSGWGAGPVGVMIGTSFNITLQNSENKDIEGLTLEVKMQTANGTHIPTETGFYSEGIIGYTAQFGPFDGVLHAREVRTIRGTTTSDVGTMSAAWALGNVTTVVDVKLGNETLDEWKFTP